MKNIFLFLQHISQRISLSLVQIIIFSTTGLRKNYERVINPSFIWAEALAFLTQIIQIKNEMNRGRW
jgi:hypothetical protein